MCYGGGWEGGGAYYQLRNLALPRLLKITTAVYPSLVLNYELSYFTPLLLLSPSTSLFSHPPFLCKLLIKYIKGFVTKSSSCGTSKDQNVLFLCRIKKFAYFLRSYVFKNCQRTQKMWNASRFCVSSLRRGHANLLCIVPILVYVLPKQVQEWKENLTI